MRALEQRLVDDVRARRAVDPRGALVLLVPSRLLGTHLRRRFARALGGVLGVHALTLPDLAERLAGVPLARSGRRPLPPAGDRLVVTRAIRAGVPAEGGYFSAVAALPNFPAAVAATLLDLKKAGTSPEALLAAAVDGEPGGAKLRELAACYRAAEATLAEHGYHDASDLLAEAARLLSEEPGRLGAVAVFVYGFVELNPLEERLLDACRRAAPVVVYPAAGGLSGPPPVEAIEIVAAPGEEREVRELARVVLQHAAAGGRFEEAGILLRQPGAYRAAIRDVFGQAGIPYSWGVAPALGETRAGRTLGLLAEVRRSDFARAAVMDLLSLADLPPGPGVSPAEWERLSRQAGVVRGAGEWLARLPRLGRRLLAPGPPGDEDGEDARAATGDRDALAALHRVVRGLTRGLSRLPAEGGPIGQLARALALTFRRLVAPSAEREQALLAVASLAALGPLQAHVGLDELWALLDAVLARPVDPGPEERLGRVFVGELAQSLGLDFPLTIVPGLAEGGFPAALRQDPLLLDEERRRLPGLPLSATRRELERVRFGVVAGSGARRLVLSYPRVEAETGRARVPSVFLLDLLAEVTGRPHDFTALERFPGFRAVALRPASDGARALPVDEREWLITRALDAREAPEALLGALPAARRGAAAIEAREWSPALTGFDGLLPRGADATAAPLSPTALEDYATCPFRFFLRRVLGVEAVEEPERVLTMEPVERGAVVHAALERAFRALAEAGALPVTPERLDDARAELDRALDEAFAEAERRGVTGLPALWEGEQARLRGALHAALRAEAGAADGWVPAFFELPFGMDRPAPSPPLLYGLPDGTTLRLRGKVDRVDLSADGVLARVVDYKTGRVREGQRPDRLRGGRALQLPVYRLAVEAWLAARDVAARVEDAAYYHVVGPDAGKWVSFTRAGWDARRGDFDRALGLVVEGIRQGRFFARPAACGGRQPCPFDLACGAERARWAAAKAADPAARRHDELAAIE